MKRILVIAITAGALLIPNFASAQGVSVIYRHELRSFVVVPAAKTPKAVASAPTPAEIIARHEAMAAGLRANPRSSIGQAAVHCDRLVAEARQALRESSDHHSLVVEQPPAAAQAPEPTMSARQGELLKTAMTSEGPAKLAAMTALMESLVNDHHACEAMMAKMKAAHGSSAVETTAPAGK
jgi:hypothetical protein